MGRVANPWALYILFTQGISVIMIGPKFKLIQFTHYTVTRNDQLIDKQVANHVKCHKKIPRPYLIISDFSLTFPGLQNSLIIPGFPGLWEPCCTFL